MRFVPNRNLNRELAAQLEYKHGLAELAQPIADNAREFAPVDEGDYRDSIEVTIDGNEVRVDAFDWKSNFLEFGTSDTPIFAPLAKGARAAGARLRE
jgi:hypothetical protein